MSAEELPSADHPGAGDAPATGDLPAGFEESLAVAWEEIAADLGGLTRGVASGELERPQAFRWPDGEPDGGRRGTSDGSSDSSSSGVVGRAGGAARATVYRALGKARRLAGPRLRAAERRSVERAAQLAEELATRRHIFQERAQSLDLPAPVAGRLARVAPSMRVLPDADADAERLAPLTLDPEAVEDWLIEQLQEGPDGRIAHVECGDGHLIRRLDVAGFSAIGADPHTDAAGAIVSRAGALEFLSRQPRGSLAGLLLTRVTDRVSPGSAQALARLASSRLQGGGRVVLVSARPEKVAADPVSADLADRKALHPVTWCHLLARYGLGELVVRDPLPGSPGCYAVVGRRP